MKTYPHKLVLRVNELHHDIGGHDEYGDLHDEIFVLEPQRWQKIIEAILPLTENGSATVLDIGSGTGFVPLQLAPHAREEDLIICSDISEGMLSECQKNVEKGNFLCSFDYRKYDGTHLPAPDASVDLATMNSVLHHIPDTEFLLKELVRIVKTGGYVVIGHEPNSRFYKNKSIWTIYRVLYLLYHPRSIFDTLKRRGISLQNANHSNASNEDLAAQKINDLLLSEKLIEKPLTRAEINNIVDYYSIRGFDVYEIQKALPEFELVTFDTYNHLYWIYMEHYRNPIIRGLNAVLGLLFPKDGKTFIAVFRKISN